MPACRYLLLQHFASGLDRLTGRYTAGRRTTRSATVSDMLRAALPYSFLHRPQVGTYGPSVFGTAAAVPTPLDVCHRIAAAPSVLPLPAGLPAASAWRARRTRTRSGRVERAAPLTSPAQGDGARR